MRDPYELLAVSRTATSEEIASSFRKLTEELESLRRQVRAGIQPVERPSGKADLPVPANPPRRTEP